MADKDLVVTTVRLPSELRAQVDRYAVESRRSINSSVLVLVEKALDEREEGTDG